MRDACLIPAINKRAKHFVRKRATASAFAEAGEEKMAEKLRDCGEVNRQIICLHCAHVSYVEDHCLMRVCPICSYKISMERSKWIIGLCKSMRHPKLLTLTMPRWRDDPRQGIDHLRTCFNLLRESPVFGKVVGGCYQIELKPKPDGWHIHLHAILDCPYLAYQLIFSAWRRILGVPWCSVDIRAANTPAEQAYVAKYASKAADYEGTPSGVVDWWRATKGKRLFGTFGKWYNYELPADGTDDPDDIFHYSCPACGAQDGCCLGSQVRWMVGRQAARYYEAALTAAGPPTVDRW